MLNLNKELTTGGRINLSKDDSGNALSNRIFFGSNWGAIVRGGFMGFGQDVEDVDLDASVVLLDENKNKVETISFSHQVSHDGSIRHSGDDRGGDTNGDDGKDNETIITELDKLNPRIAHVVFILNNYSQQTFDELPFMGLRIYTTANGQMARSTRDEGTILAQVKLNPKDPKYQDQKAIIIGEAYRHNGEWKFKVIDNVSRARSISELERMIPSLI